MNAGTLSEGAASVPGPWYDRSTVRPGAAGAYEVADRGTSGKVCIVIRIV